MSQPGSEIKERTFGLYDKKPRSVNSSSIYCREIVVYERVKANEKEKYLFYPLFEIRNHVN